jgi:alpha-glucan,water dikinase
MASYDRKICSEPSFKPDQYEGLTRDLKEYLRTLKAVHSGADLDSASEAVLGYHQDACKGKEINVPPIDEVATPRMRELLHSARGFRDLNEPLHSLEAMLEARRELWQWTRPGGTDNARLKDIIYLDLALESAVRQVVEGALGSMSRRAPVDVLKITGLALENLALSTGGNDELVICLREWRGIVAAATSGGTDWALQAKAITDRVQNALGECSQRYIGALQATAQRHGRQARRGRPRPRHLLRGDCTRHRRGAPLADAPRAGPACCARWPHGRVAHHLPGGSRRRRSRWSTTSRISRTRRTQCPPCSSPGAWAARRISHPAWWVVITPDMPDVLAHASVRAQERGRASSPPCSTPGAWRELEGCTGQAVNCAPVRGADDLRITPVDPSSLGAAPGSGR